jgi:DNA mismatch repair protein MutS
MTSVAFDSILFETAADRERAQNADAPACFVDLNLNQIVDSITADRAEYNLKPFFYFPLRRTDAVAYRQEVMRDLENAGLLAHVRVFAEAMRAVRAHLVQAGKLYHRHQKQAWQLDAVDIYCNAVRDLSNGLGVVAPRSRGFLDFGDYLADLVASGRFTSLAAETKKLKENLERIGYCLLVRGSSFTVRKYDGESDYSADVEKTFDKFKQGAVKDYRVKFSSSENMNHIEAQILEFVAKLHPEIFSALGDYCAGNADFIDATVATFDREVQFYVAYLEHVEDLRRAGLRFCYPRVGGEIGEVYDYDGFDMALARKLIAEGSTVVCNDFCLTGAERILVVSGPNQGGKTTFARAFGQVHYLASLGCAVPGRKAQLLLFDRLFTHFEKQEKVENLRGKLEDDLFRIHDILGNSTPRSIIIMNEIFTSTTILDETFLSRKVMEKIIDLNALCVWVTFVDELASFGPRTVSMVSTVAPDNPTLRTFKILRRPADGLAYAIAIAEKHGLTYQSISERLRS